MGGGFYSMADRSVRSKNLCYATASTQEIFKSRSINSAMNPFGVQLRESRDSKDHPTSLGIVLALDLTGSMGSIPRQLVKDGLPTIVDQITKKGVKDPQILFLGVGDHECDSSPLQVGQFESSDELLDHWLTTIYLEGGGGGNAGESYLLAWYFAGFRTAMDCFEKRSQKGFLFTIGDEPTLKSVPKSALKGLLGEGQFDNYDATTLLDKAKETYDVYHIHVKETGSGSRQVVIDGWKQLMGDNLIIANHHTDIPDLIASKIIEKYTSKNQANVTIDYEPTKIQL